MCIRDRQQRYVKYKNKYSELTVHYKELEREKNKARVSPILCSSCVGCVWLCTSVTVVFTNTCTVI